MTLPGDKPLKLAILDMYKGVENQGMRCINEIVSRYKDDLTYEIFDIRGKQEIPDTSFDIYIGTGGPGSPYDGIDQWGEEYFQLLDDLWLSNKIGIEPKKYVFFICHSFQLACFHFQIGKVTKRKSMSFGTFPVYPTDFGVDEPLFKGLENPFWVADFRDWQVVQPNVDNIESLGAKILALEKIRPHVPLERAMMAIRFSEEFFGVQFHPEADAPGMLTHFQKEDKFVHIINKYGKDKYATMIKDLSHPAKIERTNKTILPNFLDKAIGELKARLEPAY